MSTTQHLRSLALECAVLVPILTAANRAPAQHVYDPAIKREVIQLIREHYFRPVEIDESLPADSIVWLLDPHSEYVHAEDADTRLSRMMHSDFRGFGFSWMRQYGHCIISDIEPYDCAEQAGLRAGDEILTIGGDTIADFTNAMLDSLFSDRGEWAFELTVYRKSLDTTLRFWISRTTATPFKSTYFGMIDDTTGFVRLRDFSAGVSQELHAALDTLHALGMTSCILDLRSNPGGIVEEFLDCERLFVGGNVKLLSTRSQAEATDLTYSATGPAPYATLPLTVLVDHNTWSAAELLAGSLQDLDRALIVGQATGGKALVMRYFPLSNGDKVLLTIAGAILPSGRCSQSLFQNAHYIMRAPNLAQGDNREHIYDAYYTEMPCKWFTTAHGRPVSWHEGIIPDIIANYAEDYPPEWYLAILDTVAVKRMQDSLTQYASAGFKGFTATSHFSESSLQTIERRLELADTSKNKHESTMLSPRLQNNLEWRIARCIWGYRGSLHYFSRLTPMVRRALLEPRVPVLTGAR